VYDECAAESAQPDGLHRPPWKARMPPTTTGTIKRITDKGFGFIAANDGTEYFFHQSACTSTPFDSMREGEQVTFTVGQGPKGPRAENVRPA
jgi:CspA family cold shock protein